VEDCNVLTQSKLKKKKSSKQKTTTSSSANSNINIGLKTNYDVPPTITNELTNPSSNQLPNQVTNQLTNLSSNQVTNQATLLPTDMSIVSPASIPIDEQEYLDFDQLVEVLPSPSPSICNPMKSKMKMKMKPWDCISLLDHESDASDLDVNWDFLW